MKKLLISTASVLLLASCSIHKATLNLSPTNPSCKQVGTVSKSTSVSYFLGLGGNVKNQILRQAYNELESVNNNEGKYVLSNFILDEKTSFYFIVATKTFTLSANKYACAVNQVYTVENVKPIADTKIDTSVKVAMPTQEVNTPAITSKIEETPKEKPFNIYLNLDENRSGPIYKVNDLVYFVNEGKPVLAEILSIKKNLAGIYIGETKETKLVSKSDLYQASNIPTNQKIYGYAIGQSARIEVFNKEQGINVIREGKILGFNEESVIFQYLKDDGTKRTLSIPKSKILPN